MNEPLGDREILCVSQFTLYGDTRKGNRPSYVEAAPGEQAEPLYDRFCERLGAKQGVFGACMGVALVNDGPVTRLIGGLGDRGYTRLQEPFSHRSACRKVGERPPFFGPGTGSEWRRK